MKEAKAIDVSALVTATGGMQWQRYGQSTNVEDRRPAWAKKRDDAWWRRTHPDRR